MGVRFGREENFRLISYTTTDMSLKNVMRLLDTSEESDPVFNID
jgi:hypothetical protein